MKIFKFEILDLKEGDKVVKVDNKEVHVSKSSGEYVVYILKHDEDNKIIDFDVLAITKGDGSFDIIDNADLNDLSELWSDDD